MPASVNPLPNNVVAVLNDKYENQEDNRQLYRIKYFSKVHPDDADLDSFTIVDCTLHIFAFDANEAFALFSNNVPEHYPVFILVSIQPVSPDIPEDSMIQIQRGPRSIN